MFQWSPLMIGLSAALFGILIALVQGLLTGKAIAKFGEARTGLISLCFAVPAYLIFTFATSGWMMFAGIIVGAFGNASFPAMQSMMSRAAPENAQGELQGAIASCISVTSIIGPLMMASLFGHFSDSQGLYFPGAPFLLTASLMALGVVIYLTVIRRTEVTKIAAAPSPQSRSSSQA